MTGFAVRKDGQGWRRVDGPTADPENPSKVFPDPDTETYSETPPPDPVALPPTPEELLAIATGERDRRLAIAAIRIAPLQDAVDLGKATAAKIALLKKWKEYRIDLDDIPDQAGYPNSIIWPVEP